MPSPSSLVALDRFTTFGDLLKYLRRRSGLTQRELSIAVGYSHAQISRLELNQRLPDLATVAARFIAALDLADEPQAAARLLELASDMRREDAPGSGLPPFKGLQFFDEADADLFFGREALTAHLLDRLGATVGAPLRFLAVVGASGSGKSSLVRAGLVSGARWSPAYARWRFLCLTPTARPLAALAAALRPEARAAAAELAADLARDPQALHRAALSRPPGEAAAPPLLLVVDQFEEVFTLCHAEAERRAFIDNLLAAAAAPEGPVYVVLTLRADFYAHCSPFADLRAALAGQQVYLGPMEAAELRRAIEEPAQRGGWTLEPGLVEVLLNDIGADGARQPEPGALPLLSHALLETWSRRRGRALTVSGYLAAGGVRGAIADTADVVYYDQLDAAERVLARRIFLRLTELGDDDATAESRRRATLAELTPTPGEAEAVRAVLTRLADARLITTAEDVAEVAHEALIREWPTLRGWLEEDREGLRLHRHLTQAAEGWEAQGRDPGELYRGPRLAQAQAYAAAHPADLTAAEQAFLDAAGQLNAQADAEREAQRQRELAAARALAETEQRAAVQLRRRAIYLTGALVLALLMAGAALFLGDQARRAAVASESARRVAFARELAGAAVINLATDPERSLLLALQAISTTRAVDGTVLPAAEEALHAALMASHIRLTLTGHSEWVLAAAISADGTRLASLERDGTVIVWEAATGAELFRRPGTTPLSDDNGYQRLAFSPSGPQFAAADDDVINIWDAVTGERLRTLTGHTADVWAVAFSPDGTRLVTGGADATVRLWDVATGAELRVLTGHAASVEGVDFSPDGALVVSVGDDQALKLWDAATGALLRDEPGFSSLLYSVAFSPDGAQVWTASDDGLHVITLGEPGVQLAQAGSLAGPVFSADGRWMAVMRTNTVTVWDTALNQPAYTLAGHTNWVSTVAFSADGGRLVTASHDRTVKVWELAAREAGPALPAADEQVAYTPDGRLITAGSAGSATLWEAATGRPLLTLPGQAPVMGLSLSANGQRVILGQVDSTARVWDTTTGALLFTLAGHTLPVRDVAYSPTGTRLATAGFDGVVKLWDAATGAELLSLSGHAGILLGVAFSPDGQTFATASADQTAKLWDTATGAVLLTLTGHTEPVEDVAFSPDGRRLITGSGDGIAIVWDTATGAALLTLRGHTSDVRAVSFSPDGQWVATGGGDSLVVIWDAATGAELHRLPAAPGGVTALAFDPLSGGAQLAVAGPGGELRRFTLGLDALLPLAFSRATRALTLDECRRYLHLEACP